MTQSVKFLKPIHTEFEASVKAYEVPPPAASVAIGIPLASPRATYAYHNYYQ